MRAFLEIIEGVYGELQAYSLSDEFQFRGEPHRRVSLWLKTPIFPEADYDMFIDRSRDWIADEELRELADLTFAHACGSRCERPRCSQCGFPVEIRFLTSFDGEGLLWPRCQPDERWNICLDKRAFPLLRRHSNLWDGGGSRHIR